MYQNNLSHAQLKTYLTLLTSRDLLAHNSDRYVTTEEGHRFLEAFAQLNDVLEDRERRAFIEIITRARMKGYRPYEVNSQVERRARANHG